MSEDTQITITKDNKSFIIKTVSLCFAGLITLGVGMCGYTKYQDYRAEQLELKKQKAHKEAQGIIKAMINTCGFARITPEEQATIDKCGDDVEAAHTAISNLVDSRIIFWTNTLDDIKDRVNKIMAIKNTATYWSPENESQFQDAGKQLLDQNNRAVEQLKVWKAAKERINSFDTTKLPTSLDPSNNA